MFHPVVSTSRRPRPPLQCPVIVHASLRDSEISNLLRHQQLKVRYSESTQEHTCIFPTSGCAFLVLPLAGAAHCWPPVSATGGATALNDDLLALLSKFRQIHRRCYVLCVAALHGDQERAILSALQQRFLFSNLKLVPAHNAVECIWAMLTVVESLVKPNSEIRVESTTGTAYRQQSGVFFEMLTALGLTKHGFALEKGLGCLSSLATASREELLVCSLDAQTAYEVVNFIGSQ